MVVKWAENEKEKMERKAQRAGMDMGMGMGMYNGAPMGSPGLAPYPPYPPQNFQAPLLYPPAPYPVWQLSHCLLLLSVPRAL